MADEIENTKQAGVVHAKVDDVEVEETWDRLKGDPGSVLIDVRTQAEWTFVGVPDLSSLGRRPLLIEWQLYPGGHLNPSFTSQLETELAACGAGKDADLFFICRSGQRSLQSGEAMAAVGYRGCHNVAGGFEGPHDNKEHRGLVAGWKAAGLPWVQP